MATNFRVLSFPLKGNRRDDLVFLEVFEKMNLEINSLIISVNNRSNKGKILITDCNCCVVEGERNTVSRFRFICFDVAPRIIRRRHVSRTIHTNPRFSQVQKPVQIRDSCTLVIPFFYCFNFRGVFPRKTFPAENTLPITRSISDQRKYPPRRYSLPFHIGDEQMRNFTKMKKNTEEKKKKKKKKRIEIQ